MNLAYVTLAQAKYQCKITPSDTYHDDHLNDILIPAASAMVKNYLKDYSPYEAERNSDDDYYVDSNYEPVVIPPDTDGRTIKPEVKGAVLLLIDIMFKAGDGWATLSHSTLPASVVSMLYPLRDPALK